MIFKANAGTHKATGEHALTIQNPNTEGWALGVVNLFFFIYLLRS